MCVCVCVCVWACVFAGVYMRVCVYTVNAWCMRACQSSSVHAGMCICVGGCIASERMFA